MIPGPSWVKQKRHSTSLSFHTYWSTHFLRKSSGLRSAHFLRWTETTTASIFFSGVDRKIWKKISADLHLSLRLKDYSPSRIISFDRVNLPKEQVCFYFSMCLPCSFGLKNFQMCSSLMNINFACEYRYFLRLRENMLYKFDENFAYNGNDQLQMQESKASSIQNDNNWIEKSDRSPLLDLFFLELQLMSTINFPCRKLFFEVMAATIHTCVRLLCWSFCHTTDVKYRPQHKILKNWSIPSETRVL